MPTKKHGEQTADVYFDSPGLSPTEVDAALRRARKLRAEATAAFGRSIARGAARLFGRRPAGEPAGKPAQGRVEDPLSLIADAFRAPLAGIRASAEILRDSPDLAADDRQRFVSAVLAEEARLERVVSAVLSASEVERSERTWRVRLGQLDFGRLKTRAAA
ncbi:MAG: histidine kinase dimerization/phospho-acceptor domain-containing protein [Pseudomonadota bacterium]